MHLLAGVLSSTPSAKVTPAPPTPFPQATLVRPPCTGGNSQSDFVGFEVEVLCGWEVRAQPGVPMGLGRDKVGAPAAAIVRRVQLGGRLPPERSG